MHGVTNHGDEEEEKKRLRPLACTFLVSFLQHEGVEDDVGDDPHLDETPKRCLRRLAGGREERE